MHDFEFVVAQRPVSQQTRRRGSLVQWKQFVRETAEQAWTPEHTAAKGPVCLTLIVIYEEVAIDVDNVIKPVQDALVGLTFENDALVTDVISRRRSLANEFVLDGVSPVLADGLDLGSEFMYVKVTDAPEQEYLTDAADQRDS